MEQITIYWAGRLFNQAERIWNKRCADRLRALGYNVILPQEEAEKFKLEDGSYDLEGIAEDCVTNCVMCDVGIFNLDGPDVDSGTALEAGVKIENIRLSGHGVAIGVRTDFRAHSEDPTTGVNAMFRRLDAIILYTDDDDVEKLCRLIDDKIKALISAV
jgi:hypothetical protein